MIQTQGIRLINYYIRNLMCSTAPNQGGMMGECVTKSIIVRAMIDAFLTHATITTVAGVAAEVGIYMVNLTS